MRLPFIKMNGAGNDFVIFDARKSPFQLTAEQVRTLSSRQHEKTHGCDQLIIMEPSPKADVFMRIFNADGSEVDACGNATRCVAYLLWKETKRLPINIQTNAGILQGLRHEVSPEGAEYILVDMGAPRFDWQHIPLAMPTDKAIPLVEARSQLKSPHFISMGNPHVVFFQQFEPHSFISSPIALNNFEEIGKRLEHYTDIFPDRVNVSVANVCRVMGRDGSTAENYAIFARVWERGAGATKACGTAACAMLAAAHKIDARIRDAVVRFEPNLTMLSVGVHDNGHILLGGAIVEEFRDNVEL